MARSYIPTQVVQTHKLAVYLARYQAVLRPAMVAIDPSYGALFDAALTALLALDAVNQELYPIED